MTEPLLDAAEPASVEDAHELRALAYCYATGVDRGDADLFVAAFHSDGTLVSHDPSDHSIETRRRQGHAELRLIPPTVAAKYKRTFHLVANTDYRVDENVAIGEVYCTAHHYTASSPDPTDLVMFIRYRDRYERRDGRWRIAERHHYLDWTETRTADRL